MGRMGRIRRPYLPGGIFHLTARTLRRERRFTPGVRSAALGILAEVLPRSRCRLLAVAIMPNHLHIVVRQGKRPVAALMQPLLRRLALRLQKAHDLDGPMFWRPYASQPCLDPSHARNAIVYTHLNPVRAGLCGDPGRYRWTSHGLYASAPAAALPPELERLAPVLDPSLALPLFATGPAHTLDRLRSDYRAFVEWRLSADAAGEDEQEPGSNDREAAQRLPSPWWDPTWGASLSPLFHGPVRPGPRVHDDRPVASTPDMAAIARSTLAMEAPGVRLDSLRGRGGGREKSRLRHLIIRRLHAAGYRNIQIARFLDLSESAIWYALRVRHPLR